MKRPRRHIARVQATIDGRTWLLRMTRDGLVVRQKYQRKGHHLGLRELVDAALDQMSFRLQ